MGLIKDAIKQIYAEQGIDVEFVGNDKPRVIKTAAQAKYDDVRRTERDYTHGVHRAKNNNNSSK